MNWFSLFKRRRSWRLHQAVDSWLEVGSGVWIYTFPDHTRAKIAEAEIDTYDKWQAYRVPARTSA